MKKRVFEETSVMGGEGVVGAMNAPDCVNSNVIQIRLNIHCPHNSLCNMIYFMLSLAWIGCAMWLYVCVCSSSSACVRSMIFDGFSQWICVALSKFYEIFPNETTGHLPHQPEPDSHLSHLPLLCHSHSPLPLSRHSIQLYDVFTIHLEIPLIELRLR